MSYDLSRFSTQSFERFIQALAVKKFGAVTQIFGMGKDGAREATFNGKIAINNQEIWDGYTVVQAKYQQLPGKSPENVTWLIRQIDLELNKFEDKNRNLKRPDYYVLASNVRLSAAAADSAGSGEGGIDKVEGHLRRRCEKLGMKGCALWHADTLQALLDSEPAFRAGFDFWVTPGDVLTEALARLKDDSVEAFLPTYLRSHFRKARDVKTKDAGQTTSRRIFLDDIFIDLPVDQYSLFSEEFGLVFEQEVEGAAELQPDSADDSETLEIDLDDLHDDQEGEPPATIVRTVVERCADKFSRNSSSEAESTSRRRNCVVIIGGPGQGKSTLSQFLAQIYRARLLSVMPGNTDDLPELIEHVLQRAESEGIRLTGPSRFPVSVDLPVFADALSRRMQLGHPYSLLTHIAEIIPNGEGNLSVASLRRWLAAVPTIFILDGLDEVPHSSNRAEVVAAISDLTDTLNDLDADFFCLVTSRPQGYQNELSSKVFSHWDMASLDREDALRYGHQLATVLVSDEARRQEIMDSLSAAAKEEATAPLMTSPLQVSLLFALVETRNNIPKDRWTLFYRYYEILRDREIAKGGESGELIGQYRNEIDRLHYEIGYLLHLRGEESGGANSYLTENEFTGIVAAQLQRSGYEDGQEALAARIVNLATLRLVFLRCRTDGQIAFDVRSLQEFMAAARIMTSPESLIKARLRKIAGISHWLHVFKIACSKVYSSADLEELREEITAILDGLDSGDRNPEDALIMSGARLAAQMLGDGVPGQAPSAKRNLLSRAMRLVGTPDPAVPQLLQHAIDASTMKSVETLLIQHLREPGIRRDQSMRLLALLGNAENETLRQWSSALLGRWLPSENTEVLELANGRFLVKGNIRQRVFEALWRVPIAQARSWIENVEPSERLTDDGELFRRFGIKSTSLDSTRLRFDGVGPSDVSFSYRKIRNIVRPSNIPDDAHTEWKIVHSIGEFSSDPTLERLGRLATVLASQNPADIPTKELPWIVAAALKMATSSEAVAKIEAGALGQPDDWLAAENRWEEGITFDELETNVSTPLRLQPLLLRLIPTSRKFEQDEEASRLFLQKLLNIAESAASPGVYKKALRRALARYPRQAVSDHLVEYLSQRVREAVSDVDITQEVAANLSIKGGLADARIRENLRQLCSKSTSLRAIRVAGASAPELVKLFIETEERHYLVLLASVLIVENTRRRQSLIQPFSTKIESVAGDDRLTREAIHTLKLCYGVSADFTALPTLSPLIVKRLVEHGSGRSATQARFFQDFCYWRLSNDTTGLVPLHSLLSEIMEKAKSGLRDAGTFEALKLPKPV
ncbi:NACHT domain-containing protein [Ensifer sp. 4252]|uniref:NACHT domain-containing protein n=1 Tax=Ensifer sp. 4252 TaxID=3373915 RepID=UPI003D1CE268